MKFTFKKLRWKKFGNVYVSELVLNTKKRILSFEFGIQKTFHYEDLLRATKETISWIISEYDYVSVIDTRSIEHIPNGGIQVVYDFLGIQYPKNWYGYYDLVSNSKKLENSLISFIETYNKLGKGTHNFKEVKTFTSEDTLLKAILKNSNSHK